MKMPPGKPPNMKSPGLLLSYLRKKALIEKLDPQAVKVPGLEGHPYDAEVVYPGTLSAKQISHYNSGRPEVKAYSTSAMYGKPVHDPMAGMSDEERLERMESKFNTFHKLIHMMVEKGIPAVVGSGRGGIGKTHGTATILEHYHEKNNLHYDIVKGGNISPLYLYMKLYHYRMKGSVLVLDDSDSVFGDEDSVAILKSALDSEPVRKISYMKKSPTLEQENIPTQFLFEGSVAFLTNTNLREKGNGKGPMAAHYQALVDRTRYLDFGIHTIEDVTLWVRHMVKKHHILKQFDISSEGEDEILDFMTENKMHFNSMSIRAAIMMAQDYSAYPTEWKDMARDCLMNV